MKDTRLTEEKARALNPKEIIERVAYGAFEESPHPWSLNEFNDYIKSIDETVASIYAALSCSSYDVGGGLQLIITHMNPSLLGLAAKGYDLLGEPDRAQSLRAICKLVEGGELAFDQEKAESQINYLLEQAETDSNIDDVIASFERTPDQLKRMGDFEGILLKHRSHFIKPH